MKIDNKTARSLWLRAHGLSQTPTGALDTLATIRHLGFVQLDSVQVIARAHHHILWSRNQNYRQPDLDRLLRRQRQVFEHFTHDASVLPMDFLPMWQRQFRRKKEQVSRSNWFGKHLDPELIAMVLRRITEEGPLSTQAFDTRISGEKQMWKRPPHKMVLDYLWYSGTLATSYRDGFTKVYDLAERVFPADLPILSDGQQIAQLCTAALARLGFGTLAEIRKFWEACDVAEVAAWAQENRAQIVEVEVQGADKSWTRALACADITDRIAALKEPTTRLRVLNPFDPAIRDRARLARLFGFEYTVEMFVPAAKRQWGYYVYPLLEGDRFVGRIEAKVDRASNALILTRLWTEQHRFRTAARLSKLDSELQRLARFVGAERVEWRLD